MRVVPDYLGHWKWRVGDQFYISGGDTTYAEAYMGVLVLIVG